MSTPVNEEALDTAAKELDSSGQDFTFAAIDFILQAAKLPRPAHRTEDEHVAFVEHLAELSSIFTDSAEHLHTVVVTFAGKGDA